MLPAPGRGTDRGQVEQHVLQWAGTEGSEQHVRVGVLSLQPCQELGKVPFLRGCAHGAGFFLLHGAPRMCYTYSKVLDAVRG